MSTRIAIVHDWLTNLGGAERVVAAMLDAFPDADLFTSVYNPDRLDLFRGREVRTTFLQHIPLAKKKHQLFSSMRRLAFEQLDLSEYDVVISSTTAEAKGVITGERTKHISYMHTPTRYFWSHYDQYLESPGFGILDPLARWQLRRTIVRAREWDYAAAQRPDIVLANSKHVQKRIKKYYNRDSAVVYPIVDVERFTKAHPRPQLAPQRYALVISRLVPYKRIDIAVEAAKRAQFPIVVIGTGPQESMLRKLAGADAIFLGEAPDAEVEAYLQHADVFLFPGEEDFGITPVESMAAGTPVIAYAKGGVLETLTPEFGMFVSNQSSEGFADALSIFNSDRYSVDELQKHAQAFSKKIFIQKFKDVVEQATDSRYAA